MNNRLFTETVGYGTEASLLIHELKPGRWMIGRIEVPEEYRHQAWGSKLMDQLCSWADQEGAVIVAHPEEHLGWPVDWLEQFSFHIQENGNMIRFPVARTS